MAVLCCVGIVGGFGLSLMEPAALILMALIVFPLTAAYEVLRVARVEQIRQDLFRLRESIYDRIIAEDLVIDESVRGLIHYIHGAIFSLDQWSMDVFIGILFNVGKRPRRGNRVWLMDERLEDEVARACELTFLGMKRLSFALRIWLFYTSLKLRRAAKRVAREEAAAIVRTPTPKSTEVVEPSSETAAQRPCVFRSSHQTARLVTKEMSWDLEQVGRKQAKQQRAAVLA
jgi:hypothetical protein